jgi:hypothetical protein
MHGNTSPYNRSTERHSNRLMTEADAEDGFSRPESSDGIQRHACLLGTAGTW